MCRASGVRAAWRRSVSGALAAATLCGACEEPTRAIVRPDGGVADAAGDASSARVGAEGDGDCARDRGGCSAFAECVSAGVGRRRCVCAPGLRVQSDQRSCEGTLLVSAGRNGRAVGAADGPRVAAGGRYVAFVSTGADLSDNIPVSAMNPAPQRCYLRDVVTARTVLISADADGALTGSVLGCAAPQVSVDGRLVAFLHSDAITPRDPCPSPSTAPGFMACVYVRPIASDLTVGAPRRVRFEQGAASPYDGEISGLHMSRDGRRFALVTRAALARGDDRQFDVYVYTEGDATPVAPASVTSLGVFPPWGGACGGNVRGGDFSGDGDRVVFSSMRRYVAADDDQVFDAYVRDLVTRTTELLPARRTAAAPRPTCTYSGAGAALSYDGRLALFFSDSERLDDTLAPGGFDVFLRDLDAPQEQRFTRLGVAPFIDPAGQLNDGLALSDDGRLAVVPSRRRLDMPTGSSLRPSSHLYLLDLSDRANPLRNARLLDADARGEPVDAEALAFDPTLTADGSAVAFRTNAALVAEDTNDLPDVYLRVLR